MSAVKSLAIASPDEAIALQLTGSLLYKCGLNDIVVDELQKAGKQRLDEIPGFLEHKGLSLDLETRHGKWTINDNEIVPDVQIYVFKASTPGSDIRTYLQSRPAASGQNVLVLLDEMDQINWSVTAFEAFVRDVRPQIVAMGYSSDGITCVPISSAFGDNILGLSSRTEWYRKREAGSGLTVVEAIDGFVK